MLILTLPLETLRMLGNPSVHEVAGYVIHTVAVIGLTGYAFHRRIGSRPFWRMFAPLLPLFEIAGVVLNAEGWRGIAALPMGPLLLVSAFLLVTSGITALMTVALFRYGAEAASVRAAPAPMQN